MASEVAEQTPPRLRVKYGQEVAPALREQFGFKNPMVIPRLEKIVLNMGIGQATQEKGRLEHAVREMTVRIFNLAGEPIGAVRGFGRNEVRWVNPNLYIGLYVYHVEVVLEDEGIKAFQRQLEVE